MKKIGSALGALALLLVVSSGAPAAEIQGVTFPDTASVAGATLQLNGVGVRTAYVFVKVYVAALYLPKKTSDAKAVIERNEPKRLTLQFLREVSHEEMNDASKEGFAKTAPSTLESEKQTFMSYFSQPLTTGTVVTFDYVPGTGTTVQIGGQEKGTIAGADFMRALFATWLGSKPADESLKEGLLGGS